MTVCHKSLKIGRLTSACRPTPLPGISVNIGYVTYFELKCTSVATLFPHPASTEMIDYLDSLEGWVIYESEPSSIKIEIAPGLINSAEEISIVIPLYEKQEKTSHIPLHERRKKLELQIIIVSALCIIIVIVIFFYYFEIIKMHKF